MIVLDTHIWVWWVDESPQLSERHAQIIQDNEQSGLCVCAISCREVAKLVEYRRLRLDGSIEAWMDQATAYPGIELLALTPQIASSRHNYLARFTVIQRIKSLSPRLVCMLFPY